MAARNFIKRSLMSAKRELPKAGKNSEMKSLWTRAWRKIGEIVVLTLTLILTYYLLALWGVIVLVMAGFAKAGVILRREAQERK
jgi:hypothetical protein